MVQMWGYKSNKIGQLMKLKFALCKILDKIDFSGAQKTVLHSE